MWGLAEGRDRRGKRVHSHGLERKRKKNQEIEKTSENLSNQEICTKVTFHTYEPRDRGL